MKKFVLFYLLFASVSLRAQDPLIPAKRVVSSKWIKNDGYQMIWYMLKDTARFEMGKVSTEMIRSKSSLTVITQVQLKNMKSPWIDSTIADIKTLKPIRHSSYNLQRDMVLDFGRNVQVYYKDKLKKKEYSLTDTLQGSCFDSNLYPLLLGWLPLKNGYQQRIAIYDYNPKAKSGLLNATVQDVQSGIYESELSGTRPVWIVRVTDEIGNGENGTSTYYFDKEDRRLWKQEIAVNGRNMLMKRVE